MALNPTKSDAILFGTSQRLKSVSGLTSVNVADSDIHLSGSVKTLGAMLDFNLTMGLILRHYQSPVSIISAPLSKFAHPWITLP